MKSRLARLKLRANLCGLVASNKGLRKMKEKKKRIAEPARQDRNPRNLFEIVRERRREKGSEISNLNTSKLCVPFLSSRLFFFEIKDLGS